MMSPVKQLSTYTFILEVRLEQLSSLISVLALFLLPRLLTIGNENRRILP